MKFEKLQDSGLGGPFNPRPKGLEHLSETECWELSDRYKARRELEEEERRNPNRDPVMQARMDDLYRGLIADLEAQAKPRRRVNFRPPARKIEDITADFAANPVQLSPELVKRLEYLKP